MTTEDTGIKAARRFFERLNQVPDARRYLTMFNRQFEFRVSGGADWHLEVQDGQIRVADGPATAPERTVIATDAATRARLMAGEIGYTVAGGGYTGSLRCVEGHSAGADLSWVGILTRIAQQYR